MAKQKAMKKLLLLVFCMFIVSCADKYERSINSHFNKFILIKNLKDYEIEKIQRNIVTVSDGERIRMQTVISDKRNRIILIQDRVNVANQILNNIEKGRTWNYHGKPYYSHKSPVQIYGIINLSNPNGDLIDWNNKGRQVMAQEKRDFIISEYGLIPSIENEINHLEKKTDSIKHNPNNQYLWINSYVTIRGTEAYGLNRIKFYITQYPNGEIKSLNQY